MIAVEHAIYKENMVKALTDGGIFWVATSSKPVAHTLEDDHVVGLFPVRKDIFCTSAGLSWE